MKRMTWFRAALSLAILTGASSALAADHIDGPATTGDPTADITDVYSWVEGSDVVMILNVTPLATNTSKFSDKVQYVLHTESSAAFGMPSTKTDVICTFDVAQKIQCWVGTADYVTGDASATTGLASASGNFKVFAGLRDDPFFFNLDGFKDAVITVEGAAAGLTFDPAGCPAVDGPTSAALVGMLSHTALGTMPPKDFFAGLNVLSIVISAKKSLLNAGGPIMSVWASTNKVGG